MPHLQIVGHAAGSVRPIATPELFQRNITLFSANPLLAETVSEWAVLATLMLQRRVLDYSKLRAGEHANWGGFQSFRDIHDTVIGIWGFGDIAKAYIKRIRAFEPAKILVYSGHASEEELASYGAVKANSFEELLENCDQLHCLTGQTPQNLGMLNAEKLRLLRDGAEIVNCGRPGLIDYDALFNECKSGRLTAMLDVLPGDPAKGGTRRWTAAGCAQAVHGAAGHGGHGCLLAGGKIFHYLAAGDHRGIHCPVCGAGDGGEAGHRGAGGRFPAHGCLCPAGLPASPGDP